MLPWSSPAHERFAANGRCSRSNAIRNDLQLEDNLKSRLYPKPSVFDFYWLFAQGQPDTSVVRSGCVCKAIGNTMEVQFENGTHAQMITTAVCVSRV